MFKGDKCSHLYCCSYFLWHRAISSEYIQNRKVTQKNLSTFTVLHVELKGKYAWMSVHYMHYVFLYIYLQMVSFYT